MRAVFSTVLATVLVMALLGPAVARNKVRLQKQITGEIVSVDTETSTVVLKGITTRMVIYVDEETDLKVAGRTKPLANVTIGDRAIVKYSEVDGRHVARSIVVKPAKAGQRDQAQ